MCRWVLEKQGMVGVVAYERFTELRFTIEWLLAKPNSLSRLPAFLGPNGSLNEKSVRVLGFCDFQN